MYHQEDSRWLNLIPLFMINNPQNPDYSRTRKWVEGEPLVAIRARLRKDHGALQKIWGSSILFSRMGIAIGAHSLNKPVCIWKPSFSCLYIYRYLLDERGDELRIHGQKKLFLNDHFDVFESWLLISSFKT